ncbi:hypothetical protein H5410_041109 [Solanum commersonii]|uniref:Uncharacterized protein n=1 Tax=Solanum commersonii TaxID=4109 RepID=A0A9J5XQN8_SOLCO|nr:hypothetical protein H5410_041109 [Solanum commersonii]
MSSSGDGDRHREHLGVSRTKQAKKKKSRRPIDAEDITGSISFAPERISHDTHLFDIPFGTPSPTGTSPQLSAMRIGDSSREQSDAMASTPPLTPCFLHPDVLPSYKATPSDTPDDTMHALAPDQKDRLGTTFERKASARLSSWLKKNWDSGERPDWMLPHVFDELGLEGIGSSHQSEALEGVQIAAMSAQIAKLTTALAESERRRVVEQESMSEIV